MKALIIFVILITQVFAASGGDSSVIIVDTEAGLKQAQNSKLSSQLYRRNYLYLYDNIQYSGLTYEEGEDASYLKVLFGKLIQAADRNAKADFYKPSAGIHQNYYAFLLAALSVPYHESRLLHFARRKAKDCYFTNNLLDPIYPKDKPLEFYALERKTKGIKTIMRNTEFLYKNLSGFNQLFNTDDKIFYHCDYFKDRADSQSIIIASDYGDMGMLMVNMKSHPDLFSSKRIFDVDEVIEYGVNYLYEGHGRAGGFKKLALNSDSFSCLKGVEEKSRYEYSVRLVRGAWAGQYNAGNTSETCRFTNPTHKHYKKSVAFLEKLNEIIDINTKQGSAWHSYLPAYSVEEKAFYEILHNIRKGTNFRTSIDIVLKTNYDSIETLERANNKEEFVTPRPIVDISNTPGKAVEVVEEPVKANTPFETIKTKEEGSSKEDRLGQLPEFEVEEYKYFLNGSSITIRSNAEGKRDYASYCGSTKGAKNSSIEVVPLNETPINNHYILEPTHLAEYIAKEECKNLKALYIHSSLVSKVRAPERYILGEVKVALTTRDIAGTKGSRILGTLPKGVYKMTKRKEFYSQDKKQVYVWYEALLEDGKRVWFYAGVNGERVEESR